MIIKKLNSVFHRHSRWLFGLITIVIIISFIGFMVPGSFFGFGPDTGSGAKVGTAFGKKVTYEDLRSVHRNFEVCKQLGFPINDVGIEQQFVFYCILEKAKTMGIAASDKEFAATLKQHPMLQTNNQFDIKKYTNLKNNLNRFGVTQSDIEDAIRMIIVINKMQNTMGDSIVVTPGEAKDLFRRFNTEYELQIAEFQLAKAPGMVKPNARKLAELPAAEQKAVQAFFQTNRKNYKIPGWLNVMVVEFKNSLFTAQAAKKATDKELLKFYNANKSLFQDKNGKTLAFRAARAKVRDEFVKIESADLALRAAEDFAVNAGDAVAAADKQADKVKAFRSAADKLKLPVMENAKVLFTDRSIGSIHSADLVNALNQIAGNPVTRAVSTSDSACVGFLRSRTATRDAKLDEVLAKVRADLVQDNLYKAARKTAETAFTAIRKLPAAQQEKAFKSLRGVKYTDLKFSLAVPPTDFKFQQAAMAAVNMKPGTVSAPMVNLQMVRLKARKAPDYKNYTGKESQYMMIVRMQKTQMLQGAFMEELNSACKLDPSVTAER